MLYASLPDSASSQPLIGSSWPGWSDWSDWSDWSGVVVGSPGFPTEEPWHDPDAAPMLLWRWIEIQLHVITFSCGCNY